MIHDNLSNGERDMFTSRRLSQSLICSFYIILLSADNITCFAESITDVDLPVCVGQRLNFTCVGTGLTRNDFIDWNVTIIQDSGSRLSDTRLVSAAGQSVIRPITLNMINFLINSTTTELGNGSVSVTTLVSVKNVTSLLNGTVITCSEVRPNPAGHNLIVPVREATIYVITTDNINSYSSVNSLELNCAVPTFGTDSVMVTVAWQQEGGTSYNVSVLPQVVVNMSGPTTLQLTLAYNTLYNVTIATIVCGQIFSTTVTQLLYVDCGVPEFVEDINLSHTDSTLEGSEMVVLCEGSNKSFTSVCLESGIWSHNPRDSALCSKESKREASLPVLSYVYIAIIVILAMALFTSVITNICLCLKCKLSTKTSHDQGSAVDLSQTTQPIYETAAAVVETTTQEEELDMEKNVAYAPIQNASQDSQV